MKKRVLFILSFVILCSCNRPDFSIGVKKDAKKSFRVLLIQSSDATKVLGICQYLIEKQFRESDIPVKVENLYHITQDIPTQDALATLTKRLEPYEKDPPDLILTMNDDALNFMLATELPFTYRVPIVFSNVTFPLWELVEKHKNITGQVEVVDYRQAYELAQHLFGKIDEIQILYGFQLTDGHFVDESIKQINQFPELSIARNSDFNGPRYPESDTIRQPDTLEHPLTVSWDVITVWPFEQFAEYYDREKPRFPIRRVGIKAAGEGIYSMFFSYYYLPCINVNNAYFPVKGTKATPMPSGCLGGYMNPRENQIKVSVDRALTILKGKPVSYFPIDTAERIPVFDWNAMQHWEIAESQLPKGSRIINKPFKLEYRNQLIAGGSLIVVLIASLINILIIYSRKANRLGNSASRRLKREQQRMKLTVNSINEGIISLDQKGVILSANTAALSLLGFKGDEDSIIGDHIYSILRLSPRESTRYFWVFELTEAARLTGKKQYVPEGALLHLRNGKVLQVVGVMRSLSLNNTHIGSLFTFKDCTDQIRKNRFLEFSMMAGDVYTWKMDEQERTLTFYNSNAKGEKDMKKNTTISYDRFLEILHPDSRHECLHIINEMRRGECEDKQTLQLRLFHEGKYHWFEFRISSMPATWGNRGERFFGIALSIQTLKETESSMIRVLKEAEDSNRLKSEFLANISHEIRTPLNAILGFSTIIEEVEPEEREYFMSLIGNNCDILLQTINDILDISRVESGYPFQYKVCSLNTFLSEIWQEQQSLFTANVSLFLELPENEILIETDLYRLKQLLECLIKNANRFTPSGSVVLGSKLNDRSNHFTLYVSDTGIGIRPEDREVVFERFYKLDKFTAGGGLGLSLCKEIVKRMNGIIYITDNTISGQGTNVIVELPVHQSKL